MEPITNQLEADYAAIFQWGNTLLDQVHNGYQRRREARMQRWHSVVDRSNNIDQLICDVHNDIIEAETNDYTAIFQVANTLLGRVHTVRQRRREALRRDVHPDIIDAEKNDYTPILQLAHTLFDRFDNVRQGHREDRNERWHSLFDRRSNNTEPSTQRNTRNPASDVQSRALVPVAAAPNDVESDD